MSILVVGGAGYIGSHMVMQLVRNGKDVVVVDNLSQGHVKSVHSDAKLYIGDIHDLEFLNKVFEENEIEAVIDFAAFSLVGESMSEPLKYFSNNVGGTISLLQCMINHDVKKIVFSSTAATFGEPEVVPITEDAVQNPTNPYGESKLCVEKILKWCDVAYGLKYGVLRYFNVAGADETGLIGEDHKLETHLIPLVLKTALGQRESISVFGDDYPTEDGTCIRDYIHVTDLANAHLLALEQISKTNKSCSYNLGNGEGFSVKQIIDVCKEVTGIDFAVEIKDRRAGDPAVLIASQQKAVEELGFNPQFDNLYKIIETAWNWHKNNPNGYND